MFYGFIILQNSIYLFICLINMVHKESKWQK